MAAGWKKVLVEDANITVGTITATLGEGTDLSASSLSANLVVSSTDGASEGSLSVAEVTFGTAAFSAASDFQAAGSYLTSANMAKDLVTNNGLTGGADNILFGSDGDVTLGLAAIADMKVLGNVSGDSAAPTAVSILDEDDMSTNSATALATQQSIKAYVDTEIGNISDGDTTYGISTDYAPAPNDDVARIVLTPSSGAADSISMVGSDGIEVTQSSDQLTVGIPTATSAVTGILYAKLAHVTNQNRVLGRMGSTGAVTEVVVFDQDNMSSDSATGLATQQSIKAYVDSEVSGATITNYLVDNANDSTTGTLGSAGFIAPSLTVAAASGTNQAGTGLNIAAGQGTGTGAGGSITFQVADGGTTGSSVNALATAMTIADDKTVTVDGDLVVNGTTTTINAENVLFEDHFIALNNNAGTPADAHSGIIFQRASGNAAFGFNGTRFAFDFTGAAADDTTITPDAFPAAVVTSNDANYQYNGNIKVDGSDIYIYTEA